MYVNMLCGILKGTFEFPQISTQNILSLHWKMQISYNAEIAGALKFN